MFCNYTSAQAKK